MERIFFGMFGSLETTRFFCVYSLLSFSDDWDCIQHLQKATEYSSEQLQQEWTGGDKSLLRLYLWQTSVKGTLRLPCHLPATDGRLGLPTCLWTNLTLLTEGPLPHFEHLNLNPTPNLKLISHRDINLLRIVVVKSTI